MNKKEASSNETQEIFDVREIMDYLPHRYPFLLIDRIVEYEEMKRIVAIKNVTINEPFFQGHFPGIPIMPGVLIIEAMAQAGGFLVFRTLVQRERAGHHLLRVERGPQRGRGRRRGGGRGCRDRCGVAGCAGSRRDA